MNLELSTIDFATVRNSDGAKVEDLTWLTSKEAAFYLRKTVNALHIMVRRGHLRPRKLQRRLYFRRLELDRLLESSTY